MTQIEITVLGLPQPAGSKRAFPIRRKNGLMGVSVTDANPKSGEWKHAVSVEARRAFSGPLLTGALAVTIVFFRPRPRGHFGSGKNATALRKTAPAYPTVKPDALKLARAVEDSLTGIVYCDDSQTIDLHVRKFYGEPARAEITVREINGGEARGWNLADTPQSDPSSSTTSVA